MNYSSREKTASIYVSALEEMEKDAVSMEDARAALKKGKKMVGAGILGAGLIAGGGLGAQGHAVLSAPSHSAGGMTHQVAKSVLPGVSGNFTLSKGMTSKGKKVLSLGHSTLEKAKAGGNNQLLKTIPKTVKKTLGGLTASKTHIPVSHTGAQRALTLVR